LDLKFEVSSGSSISAEHLRSFMVNEKWLLLCSKISVTVRYVYSKTVGVGYSRDRSGSCVNFSKRLPKIGVVLVHEVALARFVARGGARPVHWGWLTPYDF